MKKIVLVCMLAAAGVCQLSAQKIADTFWGSKFGVTYEEVYDNLVAASLEPIIADADIYLKDNVVYGISFQTIGFKFTSEDAFYNIFGYNKFTTKQEATDNFTEAYGKIREQYPSVQAMSRTEGCLKLYAFADGDSGNAFSIGLYKGNGAFFVRLNIFSDYLLKREKR